MRRADSPLAATAALRRFKAGERAAHSPGPTEQQRCSSRLALAGWRLTSRSSAPHHPTGAASPAARQQHRSAPTATWRLSCPRPAPHAADPQWWRDQLTHINNADETTMDGELARAERALALWCIAPSAIVSSLFTE